MTWWIWALISIYVLGFIFTVMVNPWWASPITMGLSLLRAAVWPIWMTTGWPAGERSRM